MQFIDRFDVILLDMARTFMFDVDRFSATEDFSATYRRLGGNALGSEKVQQLISTVFNAMRTDSLNPYVYDRFPSVRHYLETLPLPDALPGNELDLLEQVFAEHEVGTVPEAYAEVLHRLRKTHRLGVVSDLWSDKELSVAELERADIRALFEVCVFSSDHGHLKPSPYPFLQAIAAFTVERARLLFVGDSLRRDIAGAKAVGLSTVWIKAEQNNPNVPNAQSPIPDLVVQDLRHLLAP